MQNYLNMLIEVLFSAHFEGSKNETLPSCEVILIKKNCFTYEISFVIYSHMIWLSNRKKEQMK